MEWKEYKLSELCLKVTDGSHYSPHAQSEGYPMFSVKDMQEFGFDYSSCKRISQEDFDKMLSSGCVPQKDDILVAKDGSYLKQIFRCKATKKEAILSSIAIFRPNQEIIISSFLCYLLKSPKVYKYISTNCVSGSALPRIVLKSFKEVTMLVPPIEQQCRIASILSSLDSKIETNNKINAKLEEMAQALFKSWFVDFEPFKDGKFVESELGMIPEGWRVGKLEEICSFISRGLSPKYDSDSDELVLGQTCVRNNIVTLTNARNHSPKSKSNKRVQLWDTLINSTGIGSLGRVGGIYFDKDNVSFDSHITAVRADNKLHSLYVCRNLLSRQLEIENMAIGSTGQTELPRDSVKSMKMLLPTDDVISTFNKSMEPISSRMYLHIEENLRLSQLRDTLLPKLMNGEIEI